MPVKQLSVSLPNTPGRLSDVSTLLGEEGINIVAISVVDAADFSIVRMVVNDPVKAQNVLESKGYKVKVVEVLAAETPHHPGGLNAILKPLKDAGINVDYLYPCLGTGEKTVLIIGVEKQLDEALKVLKANWVELLGDQIYSLN